MLISACLFYLNLVVNQQMLSTNCPRVEIGLEECLNLQPIKLPNSIWFVPSFNCHVFTNTPCALNYRNHTFFSIGQQYSYKYDNVEIQDSGFSISLGKNAELRTSCSAAACSSFQGSANEALTAFEFKTQIKGTPTICYSFSLTSIPVLRLFKQLLPWTNQSVSLNATFNATITMTEVSTPIISVGNITVPFSLETKIDSDSDPKAQFTPFIQLRSGFYLPTLAILANSVKVKPFIYSPVFVYHSRVWTLTSPEQQHPWLSAVRLSISRDSNELMAECKFIDGAIYSAPINASYLTPLSELALKMTIDFEVIVQHTNFPGLSKMSIKCPGETWNRVSSVLTQQSQLAVHHRIASNLASANALALESNTQKAVSDSNSSIQNFAMIDILNNITRILSVI